MDVVSLCKVKTLYNISFALFTFYFWGVAEGYFHMYVSLMLLPCGSTPLICFDSNFKKCLFYYFSINSIFI